MKCTVYCTAENYKLKQIAKIFQIYNPHMHNQDVLSIHAYKGGDVFFTFFGCIVFWNVNIQNQSALIEEIRPFEINRVAHIEMEELDLEFDPNLASIECSGHCIRIPQKTTKSLLTLSYALAQSTKLNCFECTLDSVIAETQQSLHELSEKGKTSLSRRQVAQRLGEIFLMRNSMNLTSDILDTPDVLWEGAQEHMSAYENARSEMELDQRTQIFNQRLIILQDLFSLLLNTLDQTRSSRIELAIVALIAVEIFLFIFQKVL